MQWCEDCSRNECVILAQYLGALNDVLFPPNMCSTDGVDLLMRRSKEFPVGILYYTLGKASEDVHIFLNS